MPRPWIISHLELRARRKRFALFVNLASNGVLPFPRIRILDVGGTWEYWSQFDRSQFSNVEIVLLNVFAQPSVPPPFTALVGDGRELSRFQDSEFDIVYSNSVLSLVGTFADQNLMAREIRRVGKTYFVQTPNRLFVLDWRTLVPFFHLLPVNVQAWCFQRVKVGLYPRVNDRAEALRIANRVRDLTSSELKALFPGATIVRERVMGLTKSFLIHSGFKPTRTSIDSRVTNAHPRNWMLKRTGVPQKNKGL